jgi:FkbM family methyltransferase
VKFSSLFVPKYYLSTFLKPVGYLKNQFQGWIFDTYFDFFFVDGGRFYIPKNVTSRVYRGARFINSNYEEDERSLLKYIDPKSTVLELGGNIGILSCLINKYLADPKQHLVVEANPQLMPALKENKKLNKAQFQIEHGLISNDNTFYLNTKAINASSALKKKGQRVKVPIINLKDLQKKYHLKFDAAIIDIEGSEIDFIKENTEFLSQLKALMIEFHPQITGQEVIDQSHQTLKELKFKLIKSSNLVKLWKKA